MSDSALNTGWKKAISAIYVHSGSSTRSQQLPEGEPLMVTATEDVHWIIENGSEDADWSDPILPKGAVMPVVPDSAPLYVSARTPVFGASSYVSIAARRRDYT